MYARGQGVRPQAKRFLTPDRARVAAFAAEINRAVIGQPHAVRMLTIAILARGHVLLEGDVGVGKTTLLRAIARALGGPYQRVEGTIDLMPADLTYHATIGEDGKPRLEPGPVLQHGEDLAVFFFNEINRARPQVHALLLRLMAERSVTAFNRELNLPHVLVFADRNRLEREETFELPAAARDRFMMEIAIDTPADASLRQRLPRGYPALSRGHAARAAHPDQRAGQRAAANLCRGTLGRAARSRRRRREDRGCGHGAPGAGRRKPARSGFPRPRRARSCLARGA